MGRPIPQLNLRCEWCKRLFAWQPHSPGQARRLKATCSDICAGRLFSWKYEKEIGDGMGSIRRA
jgi:hypothetical protein